MADDLTTVAGAQVGVLMGSKSDWPTMQAASETLEQMGIPHECNVISAHRAPERLAKYVRSAEQRGVRMLICAAGGSAHLAGVVAALSRLPVLGCPMKAWSLEGLDSLLSTVQMPKGVPVATFAIGKPGAANAAFFAAAVLAQSDEKIRQRWLAFRKEQGAKVDRLDD